MPRHSWKILFGVCMLLSIPATAQAQNTFVPTGNMGWTRWDHTATLLANGKVPLLVAVVNPPLNPAA